MGSDSDCHHLLRIGRDHAEEQLPGTPEHQPQHRQSESVFPGPTHSAARDRLRGSRRRTGRRERAFWNGSRRWIQTQRVGDLGNRLTADVNTIQSLLLAVLSVLLPNATLLVGILIISLTIDAAFALLSLLIVPPPFRRPGSLPSAGQGVGGHSTQRRRPSRLPRHGNAVGDPVGQELLRRGQVGIPVPLLQRRPARRGTATG